MKGKISFLISVTAVLAMVLVACSVPGSIPDTGINQTATAARKAADLVGDTEEAMGKVANGTSTAAAAIATPTPLIRGTAPIAAMTNEASTVAAAAAMNTSTAVAATAAATATGGAATAAASPAATSEAATAASSEATATSTTAAATAAATATSGAATSSATGGTPTATPTITPPASSGGAASTATDFLPNLQADSSLNAKIALLLPETKTTRYEQFDRPYFVERMKQLCPNCQILYSNANQDANAQLSQAEAALTNGAQVLVLDPVDSKSAGVIADKAKAQGVPVIAYDRLVQNSDGVNYYLSFDNMGVGKLQAQALVNALNKAGIAKPSIVMINGSPTDANAGQFKAGAHSVFDPLITSGKLVIAKEYDTPDWSPNNAQTEMQQALTALSNKVDGVNAANDGTAGGAYAAMKAAGVNPIPPLTGQDAQLDAVQRIIAGQQTMTVYKAIKPEAYSAAELAFALLKKQDITSTVKGKANNGKIDVPFVQLTPVAVTKDNVISTVVADKFWTVQQICTAAYAQACKAAGLQ
jgi:D-xylose transport system substrate-binding protein